MLRPALYIIGGLCLLVAALLGIVAFGIVGLVLLGGLLIERWRYQNIDERRLGPDRQETEERFVDPETGKLVAVYFHPATGERRYVAVGADPQPSRRRFSGS